MSTAAAPAAAGDAGASASPTAAPAACPPATDVALVLVPPSVYDESAAGREDGGTGDAGVCLERLAAQEECAAAAAAVAADAVS